MEQDTKEKGTCKKEHLKSAGGGGDGGGGVLALTRYWSDVMAPATFGRVLRRAPLWQGGHISSGSRLLWTWPHKADKQTSEDQADLSNLTDQSQPQTPLLKEHNKVSHQDGVWTSAS